MYMRGSKDIIWLCQLTIVAIQELHYIICPVVTYSHVLVAIPSPNLMDLARCKARFPAPVMDGNLHVHQTCKWFFKTMCVSLEWDMDTLNDQTCVTKLLA